MTTYPARIVHVSIARDWRSVYDFASRPENMPLWAAGLATGLEREGDDWIAHGPLGDVRVRFVSANNLGVIDHIVTPEAGPAVYNAFRVTPNGSGAEVMFTLLQVPGMSDTDFAADANAVLNDLQTLKSLLQRQDANG